MKLTTKMIKLRRITAVMVFAVAVIGAQFTHVDSAHAAGGTATWTGATGDNKFSTVGNWAEAALPEDGDMLVLTEATAGTTGAPYLDAAIDNDLAINFSGVSSTAIVGPTLNMSYHFANNLLLTAGATVTLPSANGVSFYFDNTAHIVGAGDLTVSGSAFTIYGPSVINGTLTAKDQATVYPTVLGVTQLILDGGMLTSASTGTYTMPVHVISPSTVYAVAQGGMDEEDTMTYTGAITLDADLTVYTGTLKTVHFTGAITGTGKIVSAPAQAGTLIVDAYAVAADPSVPGAPNTGVANFVQANPVVILAAGVVAAAAIFVASRRRA